MPLYGTFDEFGFAEILQLLNLSRKSGTLTVRQGSLQGLVHLRDGQVVEAACEGHSGAPVIYRLLGWREGEFDFSRNLRPVTRSVHDSTEALIMEGMRRIDEWEQIEREFTDLNVVLRLRSGKATERHDDLSDEHRTIMKLVDARRNVAQIIRESGIEPVQAILLITELISQDLVEKWGSAKVSTRDQVAHVEHTPPSPSLGIGNYFSPSPPGDTAGAPAGVPPAETGADES
ncbi:MAG: DUF4388 domain-containing protein [Armatimonadota bacterium]|nr:MAG: DUF4388 domain-containing protein [Armatimonadota bacterium]